MCTEMHSRYINDKEKKKMHVSWNSTLLSSLLLLDPHQRKLQKHFSGTKAGILLFIESFPSLVLPSFLKVAHATCSTTIKSTNRMTQNHKNQWQHDSETSIMHYVHSCVHFLKKIESRQNRQRAALQLTALRPHPYLIFSFYARPFSYAKLLPWNFRPKWQKTFKLTFWWH